MPNVCRSRRENPQDQKIFIRWHTWFSKLPKKSKLYFFLEEEAKISFSTGCQQKKKKLKRRNKRSQEVARSTKKNQEEARVPAALVDWPMAGSRKVVEKWGRFPRWIDSLNAFFRDSPKLDSPNKRRRKWIPDRIHQVQNPRQEFTYIGAV